MIMYEALTWRMPYHGMLSAQVGSCCSVCVLVRVLICVCVEMTWRMPYHGMLSAQVRECSLDHGSLPSSCPK